MVWGCDEEDDPELLPPPLLLLPEEPDDPEAPPEPEAEGDDAPSLFDDPFIALVALLIGLVPVLPSGVVSPASLSLSVIAAAELSPDGGIFEGASLPRTFVVASNAAESDVPVEGVLDGDPSSPDADADAASSSVCCSSSSRVVWLSDFLLTQRGLRAALDVLRLYLYVNRGWILLWLCACIVPAIAVMAAADRDGATPWPALNEAWSRRCWRLRGSMINSPAMLCDAMRYSLLLTRWIGWQEREREGDGDDNGGHGSDPERYHNIHVYTGQ